MSMPIIHAKDVRASMDDAELKDACCKVMKKITEAAHRGEHKCLFDPRPVYLYESVRYEFGRNGYIFRPIGVIGGVRQDGEYICW